MSSAFRVELSARLMGGDVLVRIAQTRQTGILTWNASGTEASLWFREGRPENATFNHGQRAETRSQVIAFVRALAVLTSGACRLEPQPVLAQQESSIDTLGEVLVGVLQSLPHSALEGIWHARGAFEVEASPTFDRLSAALHALGGPTLRAPLPGTAMASVVAGTDPLAQRAWLALLVLGGLKVRAMPAANAVHKARGITEDRPITGRRTRPTSGPVAATRPTSKPVAKPVSKPVPAASAVTLSPEARAFVAEIERAHKKAKEQTHYEFLGVATDANAEAVRKSYFELAKVWHSDRFVGVELPDAARRQAAELFRRLEEAQRVLSTPEDRKAYDYLLERRARGLPTDPKVIMEAEGLFKKGQALVRKGEAAAAEPILKMAVELNAGEAEFWIYHGFALYAAQGKAGLSAAREAIRKGMAMNDQLDAGPEFLGRIARMEGELSAAQSELKRALVLNPKNVDAQRELRLLTLRSAQAPESGALGGLLNKVLRR